MIQKNVRGILRIKSTVVLWRLFKFREISNSVWHFFRNYPQPRERTVDLQPCCSCSCSDWSMAWMVAEQEQEHPQCTVSSSSRQQFHSDTVTSGSGREGADRAAPPPSGHFYTPTSRWRLPALIIDKYFTVLHQAPSNSVDVWRGWTIVDSWRRRSC